MVGLLLFSVLLGCGPLERVFWLVRALQCFLGLSIVARTYFLTFLALSFFRSIQEFETEKRWDGELTEQLVVCVIVIRPTFS